MWTVPTLAGLALSACCATGFAHNLTIGVFGLFHPTELWVRPATSQPLRIQTGPSDYRLEGNQVARFRLGQARSFNVTSPDGGAAAFVLIVPGKLERQFRGVLRIHPANAELIAAIEMDLETAVASVISAESVPGAAGEALKAQAVVARSFYLAARNRHSSFDFCDTTHCQFLKASPAAGSDALRAAEETRGLVLSYRGHTVPALYSAACGGHTRTLPDRAGGYDYLGVECDFCLRHPENPIRGHRLGMCQQGAAGMAASGATFRAILNHYYPGTTVIRWPNDVTR